MPSEDLQRFERGEISEEEYLERCIAKAIAPYRRYLSNDDHDALREILRELMLEDPILVEMASRILAGGRRMRDPNCQ
ncbi:MAG: hypothetical protein QM784_30490 [Polyangiaceae bacterium]